MSERPDQAILPPQESLPTSLPVSEDEEELPLPEGYEDATASAVATPLPASLPPPPPPGDDVTQAAKEPEEPEVPAVTHADDPPYQPKDDDDDEPLTLLGHISELRRRLTRMVILIFLGFFACYGISQELYDFLAVPLKAALPAGSTLIYTSPQGAFFVNLKVALMASIFLTSPLTFYQLWAFVAPGLYKEEKRAALPMAFFSAFFFLSGATFCYIFVFPLAFSFFMSFATADIVPMISIEEYLSLALKLLFAFGLVFEMPLFAFFLGRMGILTPDFMRRNRKYAILIMFIVAAILTPPDVFSQCLMAAPMVLLYEISIYVAGWARKKGKDEPEAQGEPDAE